VRLAYDQTGASLLKTGWCVGTNERTKVETDWPLESLHLVPTLSRPTEEVLELLSKEASELKPRSHATPTAKPGKESAGAHHTLEQFAEENFRKAQQVGVGGTTRQKTLIHSAGQGRQGEVLWCHGREPLRQPLLRSLLGKEELAQEGCMIFSAILKYMGDLPSRAVRTSTELTDQIFSPPLKHEILRDEVYCQLMRQLTANKNPMSEERGWELLWMATGLFPPSKNLVKDLALFQRSHKNSVSADSILRLEKTLKAGQRKFPPHQVEVEGIQHKTTEIWHKVYFPDDTEEAILVESSTRAQDLCKTLVDQLNLVSGQGFSLFVKMVDKIFSIPENEFFFDFIRHLSEWVAKARPNRDGSTQQYSYQVFFMKKLWINTVPGRDRNADLIFHFHQEVPKFLRGWHSIDVKQAANLAALLYRTRFGKSKEELGVSAQQGLLQELVPSDQLNLLKLPDWRKEIDKAHNKHSGISSEDAKVEFLKEVFKLPTFGCTFFEVKQSTDQNYPELLLIAIGKQGVSLIDRETKQILVTHAFNKISNWSSGNTYFHMTIGNLVRGSKLLCETALGYKMDDMLTSYTFAMVEAINKQRTIRARKQLKG